MLLKQKPTHVENYIMVSDVELNKTLQLHGFKPKYLVDRTFYYARTNKIYAFIRDNKVVS